MAGPDPKRLFIDFDGVIHAYTSPWTNPSEIADGPVVDIATGRTSIQWLTSLIQSGNFHIHIYSRRGADPSKGGIGAMRQWLLKHGMAERYVKRIKWETGKPDYFMVIDDRAHGFDGNFPQPHDLSAFKPWNK